MTRSGLRARLREIERRLVAQSGKGTVSLLVDYHAEDGLYHDPAEWSPGFGAHAPMTEDDLAEWMASHHNPFVLVIAPFEDDPPVPATEGARL